MTAHRFRLLFATTPALLLLLAAIALALSSCASPRVDPRELPELPERANVCERAPARYLDDDSGDQGRIVWAPERCLPHASDSL